MLKMIFALGVFVGVVLSILNASRVSADSSSPPTSGEVIIKIEKLSFRPQNVEITPGTKVTWINEDPVAHTATQGRPGNAARERIFDSPLLNQGNGFSFTFQSPGVYEYYCIPHPFMKGTVTVKDTQEGPKPQPSPSTPPETPEEDEEASGEMPKWLGPVLIVIFVGSIMFFGFFFAWIIAGGTERRR